MILHNLKGVIFLDSILIWTFHCDYVRSGVLTQVAPQQALVKTLFVSSSSGEAEFKTLAIMTSKVLWVVTPCFSRPFQPLLVIHFTMLVILIMLPKQVLQALV